MPGERTHRYAALIGTGRIAAMVAPEQLLARLQAVFSERGLAGGPTGSVGFELASGVAAVRATGDLDLLLRPASPVTVPEARQLLAVLEEQAARCGCRVDVQVEGAMGAFALADYLQNRRVMLRTPHAAFLIDNPWTERLPVQ